MESRHGWSPWSAAANCQTCLPCPTIAGTVGNPRQLGGREHAPGMAASSAAATGSPILPCLSPLVSLPITCWHSVSRHRRPRVRPMFHRPPSRRVRVKDRPAPSAAVAWRCGLPREATTRASASTAVASGPDAMGRALTRLDDSSQHWQTNFARQVAGPGVEARNLRDPRASPMARRVFYGRAWWEGASLAVADTVFQPVTSGHQNGSWRPSERTICNDQSPLFRFQRSSCARRLN